MQGSCDTSISHTCWLPLTQSRLFWLQVPKTSSKTVRKTKGAWVMEEVYWKESGISQNWWSGKAVGTSSGDGSATEATLSTHRTCGQACQRAWLEGYRAMGFGHRLPESRCHSRPSRRRGEVLVAEPKHPIPAPPAQTVSLEKLVSWGRFLWDWVRRDLYLILLLMQT